MSQLTASTPTRAPASRQDRERAGGGARRFLSDQLRRHDRAARHAAPSRIWAVLEAMALASAIFDPTGAAAAERVRRYREDGA